MKNKIVLYASIIAAAFLCGCAEDIMKTSFSTDPVTGAINWENHKDTTATDVTMYKTNNATYVHVGSITTANNPAAINAQANLNQVTITAYGDSATKLVNALGSAAGQLGGTAAGAAVKAP